VQGNILDAAARPFKHKTRMDTMQSMLFGAVDGAEWHV